MGKGKLYCRACGATAYLPGFEPPEDQPDHRTRPTLEEVYEVVGGSYVVSIE